MKIKGTIIGYSDGYILFQPDDLDKLKEGLPIYKEAILKWK